MRKTIGIILVALLFSVNVFASDQISSSPNLYYKHSKDPVQINKCASIVYGPDEDAIILSDGVIYGSLKCNFVQLLGISDWYNTKVINNGITSSYTFNFSVDMSQALTNASNALIVPTVSIITTDGEQISDACSVGWSGFSTSAEIYTSTPTAVFEVGVQPTVKTIPQNALIKIDLVDTVSNTFYDPIYYSLDLLKNASQGAKLLTINDTATINSINGAIYQIDFKSAEFNIRDTEAGTRNLSLYDITYELSYTQKPTNSRVVSIFDSFDNNKINPRLDFSVCSDSDSTLLSEQVATALDVTDKNHSFKYVTTTQSFGVGKGFRYVTNRYLPTGVDAAVNYLRVIVKFPEERAARTDSEMENFSGRFLVYQIKLTEHVTPSDEDIFGKG